MLLSTWCMVLETIYSCNCITLDSRAVFQIEMSLGQRPFYHAYAPLFDILPPAFKSFSQYVKFLLLPLRPCRLEYTPYWITGASVWRMSFLNAALAKLCTMLGVGVRMFPHQT
jgi:hypothetical protein